jgi:gluconate 2-dehydrogenase gamma chain
MPTNPVSRRDVLRTLAMGAVGGSVLQLIPLQAAEQLHHMVKQEKTHAPAGKYRPKFFPAHQYATLAALCDAILPADDHSGGAVQAGAPEFIDLLTSENKDYQLALGGGLMWLDGFCGDRYGHPYLSCSAPQQKETLDLIAYRKNTLTDAGLSQGAEFFAFLRRLTTDAFYSSEIGMKDLEYMGNTFVKEFPGCPPLPET